MRKPLGELKAGAEFIYESSRGPVLAHVESFFRADRVWYMTEDNHRDWMYTSVEVESDN